MNEIAPTTLVLGNHPFPHGNASANRMLGLARVFTEAGEAAVVISDDHRLTETSVSEVREVSGIPYMVLGAPAGDRAARRRRRASFPERALRAAWGNLDTSRVDRIVVPSMMFTPATKSALRFYMPGTTLIADIVERHDPTQFRTRWAHPYFLRNRFTNWYCAQAADGVIVISSALGEQVSRRRRSRLERTAPGRVQYVELDELIERLKS